MAAAIDASPGALGRKVLIVKPDYQAFPVGIAYVISALRRWGIAYDFFDAKHDTDIDLSQQIAASDYLAVASGGLIFDYQFFKRLFKAVKRADPKLACILGGNITADCDTKVLMDNIPVDYLVIGEAEETFPALLHGIASPACDFSQIRGITFRTSLEPAGFKKTRMRARMNLAADNYMPVWDFLDLSKYDHTRMMPVLTGRGCVGRCTFCSPTNGRFRERPIEHIIEEIELLNASYDFDVVFFMNEIFFQDDETLLRFCEEYSKLKPFKPWRCLMRMDVDPRVLEAMKRSGCLRMNLGLESGSERILEVIKKDITAVQSTAFIRRTREVGIYPEVSFMMANYDETAEDVRSTVDLLIELGVSGPMALTINYPGSGNYRRAKKRGLIDDEDSFIESLEALHSQNYYQVISGHLAGELRYLNLSAMPIEELFGVVEMEMRRLYTSLYSLADAEISSPAADRVEITGSCPFCDRPLSLSLDAGCLPALDLRMTCPFCDTDDVFLSPFEVPGYATHFARIRDRIQRAKRPVFVTWRDEPRVLLKLDLFAIPYASALGFVAHERMAPGYALNHPIAPLDRQLDKKPDLILVASSLPPDVRTRLVELAAKSKLPDFAFLSRGQAFERIVSQNDIHNMGLVLVIPSGPAELLDLLVDLLQGFGDAQRHDLVIQESRRASLNDWEFNSVHTLADGYISRESLNPGLLQHLRSESYDRVIFLANSDEMSGCEEVADLARAVSAKEVLCFPMGNLETPGGQHYFYRIDRDSELRRDPTRSH